MAVPGFPPMQPHLTDAVAAKGLAVRGINRSQGQRGGQRGLRTACTHCTITGQFLAAPLAASLLILCMVGTGAGAGPAAGHSLNGRAVVPVALASSLRVPEKAEGGGEARAMNLASTSATCMLGVGTTVKLHKVTAVSQE